MQLLLQDQEVVVGVVLILQYQGVVVGMVLILQYWGEVVGEVLIPLYQGLVVEEVLCLRCQEVVGEQVPLLGVVVEEGSQHHYLLAMQSPGLPPRGERADLSLRRVQKVEVQEGVGDLSIVLSLNFLCLLFSCYFVDFLEICSLSWHHSLNYPDCENQLACPHSHMFHVPLFQLEPLF